MASSSNGDAMKPQFFTIILSPPLQLHQLRIPPAFIEEHGRTLLDHAFLQTPEGEQHKVGLTIDDEGHLWFDEGWEEFAARFSLGLGSFLVFRYEGNSRFHVLIFDKSCSEIAYPEFDPTDEDNPGEDEIVDAVERAQAFESDNPYFVVPMRESYLKGCYRMWVPASYSKMYMTSYNKNKEIRLELEGVPNGKTWRVNVLIGSYLPKRSRKNIFKAILGAGWKSFAIENGLSVGDACVFEQIDKEAKAFRVYIFRGKQRWDPDEDDDDSEEDEHDDDDTDNNQGINGAKERAKAFRSDNPCFLANMRETYLSGDFRLWVTARHAKRYLLGARNNVLFLKLAEEHVVGDDDETWRVNFSSEPSRNGRATVVRITAGWRDFALDNDLQVGDACVFELTDQSSMTYRVHIYREHAAG